MSGRQFSANTYKYGFNGKENDPETGTQDYGLRIYNPALGKFLSVDPLSRKYPELTPYQFASNRPIDGIDLDGLEYATFTILVYKGAVAAIKVSTDYELKAKGTKGAGIQYNYKVINDNGEIIGSMPTKFVKNNIYGIYAGSDNPQLPSIGGNPYVVKDDYSLAPIDEVDAAAKKHDLAYDKFLLKGFDGIMDDLSKQANRDAVNESNAVLDKYNNGGVDNITGKKISFEEYRGASTISNGFDAAEAVKATTAAPGKAIDEIGDFIDDVKFKTKEGIDAINNWSPQ